MILEDKVLVVFTDEGKKNSGGPGGFISQLIRPFKLCGIEVTPPITTPLRSRWKRLFGQPETWLNPANLLGTLRNPSYLPNRSLFKEAGMASARILWFMHHAFYELFAPFIQPDQIVIYQPHCPELPWMEVLGVDEEAVQQRKREEKTVRDLIARSSVLVLPNEGARSIYESLIGPDLELRYLQSGAAIPSDVGLIPLDPQFTYLLYIGRRLPIKGFDIVREAFSKAYASRQDLRLIVCGSGEPLLDPGVIDIGFTSRIHDWIASVDCVVNANRQSYLDLSVMETLAIGTPIIMSATHGHEVFQQFNSADLHCLNSTEPSEFARSMTKLCRKDRRQVREDTPNHQLYAQEFSIPQYHERLEEFANLILSKYTSN